MRFIHFYVVLIVVELLVFSLPKNYTSQILEYLIRAIVMLALPIYFWKKSVPAEGSQWRQIAFSAMLSYRIGDILLIITHKFLLTVALFMIGHSLCIWVFHLDKTLKNLLHPTNSLVLFFVTSIVGIISMTTVSSMPPAYQIPAIFYVLMGSLWLLAAYNRIGFVEKQSGKYVFIGVFLFLFSNSAKTMNLFVTPIEHAYLVTVPVIVLGEYLIFEGILRNKLKEI